MTENFPKLMSKPKPQVQEAQWTPNRINAKKPYPTPRHIQSAENQLKKKTTWKMPEEKTLNLWGEKNKNYSSETMQARRVEWNTYWEKKKTKPST